VDLVLLDIMMPRMSGYQVCSRMRQLKPVHELPIIFLTARNQPTDLAHGFDSGANDYLTKPVAKQELLSRVALHLQLLDINRTLEKRVTERTSQLQTRNDELEMLDHIVKTINREMGLKRVLQLTLEQGLALFPQAAKGTLILWNRQRRLFEVAASQGYDTEMLEHISFTRDELLYLYPNRARKIGRGIFLIRDSGQRPVSAKLHPLAIPKSILVMAMTLKQEIVGFLALDNFDQPDAFDDSDLEKLVRFREHAVSAVTKARFLTELQEKTESILRTQNHLVMREKMVSLGILTAGIAHAMKNPLNFINNFAEFSVDLTRELAGHLEALRGRTLEGQMLDEVKITLDFLLENSGMIHKHGRRANQIVQSMMMLTRDGVGQREDTDLNYLVNEYTNLAYHGMLGRYPGLDVAVELDFDPAVGNLVVVPQNMGRALIGLVNNALESLQEKCDSEPSNFQPRLIVRTLDLGEHVSISVSDNGCGIAEDNRDKIFNPFFTTKDSHYNIGLGLAHGYDVVVREHQGTLRAIPRDDGFTEFLITLPRQFTDSNLEHRSSYLQAGSS